MFKALRAPVLPALLLAGALAACSAPGGDYDDLMNERGTAWAERDSFSICHGHGCRLRSQVGLTDLEWDPVADLFAEPAASAAIERGRIATAIGILETAVGRKTGTSEDEGGTLNAVSGNLQLDCVDETTNTSIYLTLLARAGYLKWHKIEGWAGRGALIDGNWPHQTAVILELRSKTPYAVDSWFEHNGRAAHVVPLAEWRDGWTPPGFSDRLI
jgi:hypothetical protein